MSFLSREKIITRLEENEKDLQRRENLMSNESRILYYKKFNERKRQELYRDMHLNEFRLYILNLQLQIQIKKQKELIIEYKNSKKNQIEQCSICREEIIDDKMKTRCNHYFHIKCITKWKNLDKNTCPNCRTII